MVDKKKHNKKPRQKQTDNSATTNTPTTPAPIINSHEPFPAYKTLFKFIRGEIKGLPSQTLQAHAAEQWRFSSSPQTTLIAYAAARLSALFDDKYYIRDLNQRPHAAWLAITLTLH